MPNVPPYRPACAGYDTDSRSWRQNHRIEDHAAIPTYSNETAVPNPSCTQGCEEGNPLDCICPPNCPETPFGCPEGEPATVPPFPLPPCSEEDPPCGDYPTIPPVGCSGVELFKNCFPESPDGTYDFAVCRKLGFKNLRARKTWHGRFGFLTTEQASTGPCCEAEEGFPDGCCHEPEKLTPPDTVKYLTIYREYRETSHQGPTDSPSGFVTITSLRRTQYTVDRFSGTTNQDLCEESVDGPSSGVDETTIAPGARGIAIAGSEYRCGQWAVDTINAPDIQDKLNAEDPNDPPDPDRTWTVTKSASNTVLEYTVRFDETSPPAAPGVYVEVYCKVVLSNPYTEADVREDARNLLAEWDMADDVLYPWRTDNNCSSGPLIYYNESASPVSPDVVAECGHDFGRGAPFTEFDDGEIIGKPLPIGFGIPVSTDGYWDIHHENMQHIGGAPFWEIASRGARSPYPHATKWTVDGESPRGNVDGNVGKQRGAWQQFDGSVYVVQIWAEIIPFVRPSHNFARPCGATDKSAIDQTTITCLDGAIDDPGTLRFEDVPCFCKDPAQTEDCETPESPEAVNKWNDAGRKGDYIIITELHDSRDIGERARLKELYDGRIADEENECYTEVLETLRPITGSLKTITVDQHCAAFSPCRQSAVFIMFDEPEGTDYNPAYDAWFGIDDITLDARYGNQWNRDVNSQMADPLWQAPATPCDLDPLFEVWTEDDGGCHCDGELDASLKSIRWYAQRPFEEARCELPTIDAETAPALPPGCYINFLSADDLNAGITTGKTADIPSCHAPAGGLGAPFETPWGFILNQEGCCANDGRFAEDYRRNGIACVVTGTDPCGA